MSKVTHTVKGRAWNMNSGALAPEFLCLENILGNILGKFLMSSMSKDELIIWVVPICPYKRFLQTALATTQITVNP